MTKYFTVMLVLFYGCVYTAYLWPLDLIGIYEIASEQDLSVRIAREQLNITLELKPQAEARLNPLVSLVMDGQLVDAEIEREQTVFSTDQRPGQTPQPKTVNETLNRQYTQTELSLRLSYPIYRRDYWIQLDQTDDAIAKAKKQLAGVEVDLIVRTSTAYFNILAAADDLRAIIAEKNAYVRQLYQVKERFKAGVIPMLDVHESQATYDGILAKELAANSSLSDSWESLWEIVGGVHHPLAKLGDEIPLHPPQPNNLDTWIETALQNNKNIQAAQQSVNLTNKDIQRQQSGYYPTLDFVGSIGFADSSSTIGNNRDANMIGLQLIVPIYQGGAVNSRTRQSVHEHSVATETLDQQRRIVNRQIRNSFSKILSTIGQIKALQAALFSAKTALETTKSGVEAGVRTTVDVLNATKEVYQVERSLARARYDYIINGLLLYQAAGTLDKDVIEQVNSWLTPNITQDPPTAYSTTSN